MVGDFMVCVDRIIASACFDHTNGLSGAAATVETGTAGVEEGSSENKKGAQQVKKKKKKGGGEAIECRICQEEGEEGDMESPCACNGTLKFAHRKCIQRWCNKKGDITCEICNQVYTPNYSIPPNRVTSDVMAIDIRQNWAAGLTLMILVTWPLSCGAEFLRAEYENYAAASSNGISCFNATPAERHVLMVVVDSGMVQDISSFFNVTLLQFLGFLLPCYVIARACYILQSRRRRQV